VQLTKQQQILGYFIEEAKEHLDTIENGLLNLQATLADQESVNELFRAAHSVKGGAAMLGLGSIQTISHYLEDSFKILKEHPVKIDQRIEALFLKGFDTLKDLLEALQSPYGLREDEAEQAVRESEPTFQELEAYLNRLMRASGGLPSEVKAPLHARVATVPPVPQPSLSASITTILKQMLQVFKQGDSATGRQQLKGLCDRLMQSSQEANWQRLVQAAQMAINNSKNAYATLAPIVIKELKQSGDLLVVGRVDEIVVSRNLQQLAGAPRNPVAVQPLVRENKNGKHQQITVPVDPKAASKVLLEAFNKEQLVELADLILRAIQ
jgi:chemotaxis protein histidine kinase CheA